MHVLVVDDHPGMAETLAMLVTVSSPHEITTDIALNGAQALELAMARPPAVVLMDIDMPVMNGIDASKAIKRAVAARPMIIGITGNLLRSVAMSSHLAFDRLLAKPVDIDELLALLLAAKPD